MARVLIACLHLLIAATAGLGALLWAVQMRLNVAWEMGLYGQVSLVTVAGLVAVCIAGVLSLSQAALAAGWLLKRPQAGWGLLLLTLFYVCLTPPPIRWMLMLAGILIGLELVVRRAQLAQAEDESAP